MPWADKPEKSQRPKSVTGSRRTKHSSGKQSKNDKSTFPFLFHSEPDEEEIKSVNDFLKLPTPYE